MKVSILTTETIHHTFFVRGLIENGYDVSVFCEKKRKIAFSSFLVQSFELKKKKFDALQEDYEVKRWFNGNRVNLKDICEITNLDDINSSSSIRLIQKSNPNLIIVFGTGKIKRELINLFNNNIYNLHGGDPEKYRGLDSHYWAIYHKDYGSLKTSLHKILPKLDTGDIYKTEKIKLWNNMSLFQLRSSNTELCLELSLELINNYQTNNKIKCFKQKSLGRYYSIMPESLKFQVNRNFRDYILENFN